MPEVTDDDLFAPAATIARRIRAGEVSSSALVAAIAACIARLNPTLNAFVTVGLADNLKLARKEAAHADRMLKEHPGMDLPPLHGVPVAVKDDLAVKGMPLTNGSQLCGTAPVDYEDLTVTRIRAAGAIVLGKTMLPEFGHKSTTDNMLGPDGTRLATVTPWDTTRTAGGSSGGSAAAVAAGLAYLALGTDVGGSVRVPASCCGVVGFKPTFGVVPRFPSGNAFTLWGTGPIARTVGDVALAMKVLADPHPGDRFYRKAAGTDPFGPPRPLGRGVKVAWYAAPTGQPVEAEVEKVAFAALRKWARAARVTVVKPDEPMMTDAQVADLPSQYGDAVEVGTSSECAAALGLRTWRQLQTVLRQNKVSRTFLAALKSAAKADLGLLLRAQAAMTSFCEDRADERFAGCNLIATPTIGVVPFDSRLELGPDKVAGRPIDPDLGWFFTWPFNVTGEPAVSVPAGWTASGLPVGIQLVGRRGADALVLRAAASVEARVPWAARRPNLHGIVPPIPPAADR